eukprot:CAMPEP_0184504196 /NCGR_PEP_ID=MMETSP0113_2-20130426/52334_1 /TAXON_ID=91329 /ORGANISM="Norrisiella sphaerica, Strain BC52" /LENGTH=634 /DNA_ID=CAMNT_0026893819 /DNA_START=707 /DNA_END=2611 /DNA_ORIENTATION=-
MYTDIDSAPCVRLLTKDGEIGCSTEGRTPGVLRLYDDDFDQVLRSPPDETVSVAVPMHLFNESLVATLQQKLKLAGILILQLGETPSSYSPDEKTPQSFMARVRGQHLHKWNPTGSKDPIILKRYGFGIVAATAQSSRVVYDKAKENENRAKNGEFQEYMAEFNFPMFGHHDSISCLKYATCLPVGGWSVWTTMDRLNATRKRPIVLATAMMDSSALFHDLAVGANSYQAGLVALLGAVNGLHAFNSSGGDFGCESLEDLEKQIMVAFLQGEQFGYVGSRRLALDLMEGLDCVRSSKQPNMCIEPYRPSTLYSNINITQIQTIIEVGQVGMLSESRQVFMHRSHLADRTSDKSVSENLQDTMRNLSKLSPLDFVVPDPNLNSLPPSSIPSFLEIIPSSLPVASMHLSEFNTSFRNPYYLSRFDKNLTTADALENLCHVARTIARLLYTTAGGSAGPGIPGNGTCLAAIDGAIDCEEVKKLYGCITQNPTCDLIGGELGSEPNPSKYTGVFFLVDPIRIAGMPAFLQNYLSAKLFDSNQFGAAYHNAIDPALSFDYQSDKWVVRSDKPWSGNMSEVPSQLFTESNWPFGVGTRIYRRESPKVQAIMLGFGLGLTVMAGVCGFFAKPYILQKFKTS